MRLPLFVHEPMTYKNQIKDLAMIVNGPLTAYIAVHNRIFQEAADPFSVHAVGSGGALDFLFCNKVAHQQI